VAKFPENGTPTEQAAHMREWGCGGCQRGALTIDALAADNAALRAELAFARSTGDEVADSAALQCTGCVGVTKPICGHFAEKDDGEGRVSHYCATCGHSNECHEPASTAHSAPAAHDGEIRSQIGEDMKRFYDSADAPLTAQERQNLDDAMASMKREPWSVGGAETVTAVEKP